MKHSIWMRLALIVLSVSMVLSFAACKPAGNDETTAKETEQKTEVDTTVETEATTDAAEVTTEAETPVETDAKPEETTAKKPVETTEKKPVVTTEKKDEPVVEPDPLKVYIAPSKLVGASVNANRLDAGVLSADGSYVTYANKADGGDGYVLMYSGGATVSGQYLVIKYRYSADNQVAATNIEIFSSTVNGGPAGGDNTRLPAKADGEWHIAVVDMASAKSAEKFPAGADGKYTVKYARFDILDGSHKVGDKVDVAYAGITDDLAEVIALAKKEGAKTIDLSKASGKAETIYTSTGTTTPTVEDIVNVYVTPDKMVNASTNARFSAKELSADGKYVTFTANGTGNDGYALLYTGGAVVSGQYLVFKYRYRAENACAQTYIEIFTSCTNGGATGGDNLRVEVTADGEWHVAVADLSALNSKFVANDDGAYIAKYARFDIFDSGSTGEGDKVDIAYVGFTDNIDNVLKANKDVKNIYYKLGNDAALKYTLYTSTGTTEPAMTDVANLYFDAAAIAEKAPKGTNIGTVTLAEDGSYVSINGKGKSDGFFVLFSGNTEVTGQYIVMKYRYVAAEGATFKPTGRPLFSGNVYAGPTGDDTTGSFPIIADGEWHMTVFNLVGHLKDTVFVANEDGTYTVKYLRFDIADNLPEDCAFDIQYIALTDDNGLNNMIAVAKGEGLETVTARLDSTVGTQTYYTATGTTEPPVEDDETETGEGAETDAGEVVDPENPDQDVDYNIPYFKYSVDYINNLRKEGVNGNAGVGGTQAMGHAIYNYETDINGCITIKGWFAGWGGVEKYQYSIDGGATWVDLSMAGCGDLSTNSGVVDHILANESALLASGYNKNGYINSLVIDLSHLVDVNVTVTVCAILTSGDRCEFLQILNVFAHCTHEANTTEWVAIEGDIQRLASTCSECGKDVVKFIGTTTDGLKLADAAYLASLKTTAGKTTAALLQDENGMYYAHFEVTDSFSAENNLFVWNGETFYEVGQYVAFLYRTEKRTCCNEMFTKGDSTGLSGKHQTYPSTKATGNWELIIVDCSKQTSKFDKTTGVNTLRVDLFNSGTTYVKGDYCDIAYLAFFDSADDAIDYYKTYVDAYLGQDGCSHLKASGEWEWTGVEGKYEIQAECLICGDYVVKACPHETKILQPVAEKGEKGELYEAIVCTLCHHTTNRPVYYYNSIDAIYGGPEGTTVINPAERNNYQQTNGVNGAPESGYLTFDATGKLIDKDKNPIEITNIFGFSGWLGVNGGVDRYVYKINDGAWLTPSGSAGTVGADSGIGKAIAGNANIIDKTGSLKNASYQGKLKIMGMQAYAGQTINITIGAVLANNPGTASDPNVIILAVVNNIYVTCTHVDPANEWVKAETVGEITCVCVDCGETITKVCDHSVMEIIWNDDAKLYKGECVCGHTYENEVVYRAEGYIGSGTAESQNNFITAVKDGDVVRYTPTKSSGDPYFYPYKDGKAVTGQYAIIKYRLVNNGKDMSIANPFASSAASGQTAAAGKNGDASNLVWGGKLYADGNWHSLVVIPRSGNATFIANEDGTYSWAYLRLTFSGFAAYDGSCYIEVAEVAFVDNVNAAEHYAYSSDNKAAPFNLNLDDSHNTLNGSTYLGGKGSENATYTIDFTGKTLNAPDSIVTGGWLCTPGGVAAYKYRVVSVNGVAVADPTLVNWSAPGLRNDIYTAVGAGKGYSSACANGAGFKATLDFSAYEGKTINVEIVAITNYGGAELVIVALKNITVPCSHAKNTNTFAEKDGDMFRLAADCSACGEEIYQTIDNVSGLRLWSPYELQNLKTTSATTTLCDDGFPFVRIELTGDTSGETNTQINVGAVSNVGSYVAFLYRRNDTVNSEMQFFIRSGDSWTGKEHMQVATTANEWQYLVFDLSSMSPMYVPADGLKVLRLDTFNGGDHVKGSTVDLGFVAFFNSAEEAWIYFEAYREEYNITNIECPFTINFDGVNTKLNGSAYITSTNKKDTAIDIDYSTATLNDAKSVTVGGWCVTPGGCANFSYYVIDKSGATPVKSERKLLIVSATGSAEIIKQGTNRNFGDNCGLGASTGGGRIINLTGYEGKTVDVQVVVCTNYGPEIVVANLTNITVPTAE